MTRRGFLGTLALALAGTGGATESPPAAKKLTLRLSPDGWGTAKAADIQATLESAAGELLPFFPEMKPERVFVTRGRRGPMVLYRRNALGERVMELDTKDYFLSQYVYQFAHELCHILCGFDDDWQGNRWFEEALCEAASLWVLRRLGETWKTRAPREVWKPYAPEFRAYAERVIKSRRRADATDLRAFYRRYRQALTENPLDRELSGAVAVELLPLFEAEPEAWEAVSWLNPRPLPPMEPFAEYLVAWRRAVPPRRREFVDKILRRFGVEAER